MSGRWLLFSFLMAASFSTGWMLLEPVLFPASEAREKVELARVQPAAVIQPQVQVLITGAVKQPGLYKIPRGALVYDLIQRAGGLTSDAEVAQAQLAQVVPERGEVRIARALSPSVPPVEAHESEPVAPPEKKSRRKKNKSSQARLERIDLNRATLEQLDQLPGVGPKMAERILALRQQKGRFLSLEELKEVKGIGDRRFEELRRYLQ